MIIAVIVNTSGRGGAERVSFTLAGWLKTQPDTHVSIIALHESKKRTY